MSKQAQWPSLRWLPKEVSVEPKIIYTHFEGMCWPVPGERMNEVEWTLRHSAPSRTDCLLAASIISAYRQMVGDSEKQRRFNLRHIRAALKKEVARIPPCPWCGDTVGESACGCDRSQSSGETKP